MPKVKEKIPDLGAGLYIKRHADLAIYFNTSCDQKG